MDEKPGDPSPAEVEANIRRWEEMSAKTEELLARVTALIGEPTPVETRGLHGL